MYLSLYSNIYRYFIFQGKLVVLKTSAWTPLLVDLNRDGSEDIVVVTSSITTTNSNITITAFNGPTLKPLWHFSTPSMARILGYYKRI